MFEALSPGSPAEALFGSLVDLEASFPTHIDWVQGVVDDRYQEVIAAWKPATAGATRLVNDWRTVRPQLVAIVDVRAKRDRIDKQLEVFTDKVEQIGRAVHDCCALATAVAEDFIDKLETAIRLDLRGHFAELHPTASTVLDVVNKVGTAAGAGAGAGQPLRRRPGTGARGAAT